MNNADKIILNNGVEMPLICLGTWNLRGDECVESVKQAIAFGYRLIDTAQMYQNEAEVGKGISQRGISVIPKSRHEFRMKENLDILDFELSDYDIQTILQLDQNDTLFPWTKQFYE